MRLVAYSTIETSCRSQGDLLNAANPTGGAASEYPGLVLQFYDRYKQA